MHMGSENMICGNETENLNMGEEFAGCLSRYMHQFGNLPVKKVMRTCWLSVLYFASSSQLVEDNAALK